MRFSSTRSCATSCHRRSARCSNSRCPASARPSPRASTATSGQRTPEPLPIVADEADLAGGFRAKLAITPRPYQSDALAAWLAAESRGVVVLPTGAGKTILALMAIERMGLRTLVVVPTIELLYQWRDAAIERLGLPKSKVGVVGDGRRELRPITI